jgi:fatty acid desaturase
MKNSKRSGGLGFCGTLTIVFIVLKLVNVINWSWLWVLSPLWIDIVLTIILLLILELISNSKTKKWHRSDKLKW